MRIFILLLLLLWTASCKNKSEKSDLIPRNTLREILVDLHLADGYYMQHTNLYQRKDSVNFYNQIFAEYGYKRAQFDSTLAYYTKHPKKLDGIYEEVITKLQKMEQENSLLYSFANDSARNLYKGKKHWLLPREGITQKIPFSVSIKDSGTYSVTVNLKLLPLDNAKNPRLTVYFWYNDSTKEGFRDYFKEIDYQKTRRFVVCTTSKKCPNRKITHIKGWILNYDEHKYSYRFAEVKTIIVARN